MRTWLRQHRRALAAALARLAAQKGTAALNALAIGIALALPAGGYTLLDNLRAAAGGVRLEPQISVFLRPEAARAEAEALAARFAREPRVREVRLVPREQALKELQAVEGFAELVAALEKNPLPDALVLRLHDAPASGTAPAAVLEAFAAELRALPAVAHVQADSLWARRLAAFAATARQAIALLAVLLAFGLVAITFNTVRLQLLTQRSEIEVAKLIGATDAFIRRPFFYLGALLGIAGGLLALAILWASVAVLNAGVMELASTYGSAFRLRPLSGGDAIALVLFAAALGWLGAFLSVSIHLREI